MNVDQKKELNNLLEDELENIVNDVRNNVVSQKRYLIYIENKAKEILKKLEELLKHED